MTPTVTLAAHGLDLVFGTLRESRPFSPDDSNLLQGWARRHRELASALHSPKPSGTEDDQLIALGQEIYHWLNSGDKFLERMLAAGPPRPLLMTFLSGLNSDEARRFLDAPWELLAGPTGGHWALRQDIQFCPVRRLNPAGSPPAPSPHRLSAIFMAAAPHGADNLSYEAEEVAILRATRRNHVDLIMEESGELEQLAVMVAQRKPEVVYLSCHGTLEPEPALILETETGDPDEVDATRLVSALGSHLPRLLFLSACQSAQADPVLDSLSLELVRDNLPAVAGWAAPVLDQEASLFAALLFKRLTNGESLEAGMAEARFDLNEEKSLPERSAGRRSRDWHLARLYLSPSGGGTLANASGEPRITPHAEQRFLDQKNCAIPVASRSEFVGRRRQIQTILREFRNGNRPHAGVLIHGMGNQGKSSLAARVAQRLEPTHRTVVVFGWYDAVGILQAIDEQNHSAAVSKIVRGYLEQPDSLQTALCEILKLGDPMLLIVDDFEQAIDPANQQDVLANLIEPIRALLLAFRNTTTSSRLLFTSRFVFRLPHNGGDLARHLLPVPLPGMTAAEGRKQAEAKWVVLRDEPANRDLRWEELDALFGEVVEHALGNPGLHSLLFQLALTEPVACRKCLAEMAAYLERGAPPTERATKEFLENLAVQRLIGLLTAEEKELLRAGTLFRLPVPTRIWKLIGVGVERLAELGLVERYEDPYDPHEAALAVNKLVQPLVANLSNDEERQLASVVAVPLLEVWGG